jgi:hypothetical protein
MLSLQLTYPHRRRKVAGSGPPPAIFAVFVGLSAAVTLAMLGYALEDLRYSAAAYFTALTIGFFTVVFGFVIARTPAAPMICMRSGAASTAI